MAKMVRVQIPDFFEIGIPVKKGKNRDEVLRNFSWVLNCWLAGIQTGYAKGAPRRVEVNLKIQALCSELRTHLNDAEWYQLRKGLLDEETGEAYDLQ